VAADLRGYGDSSKPVGGDRHLAYSKRAMANDLVKAMASLGFDRFSVAGHDRGGRVGHRLALDHPERLERLAVLDIAPTHAMYTGTDMEFAHAYFHWFFLIQPFDLPERLIGSDPEYFLRRKLGQWGRDGDAFTHEAMSEYLRCFTPETIHASCEDYRASATVDLEHDQASIESGQKVECPVLALWGEKGFVGRKYDVIAEWRKWAAEVSGRGLPCGHYLPEEAPEETLAALLEFLG
jgi:haloacetate dehalogenase